LKDGTLVVSAIQGYLHVRSPLPTFTTGKGGGKESFLFSYCFPFLFFTQIMGFEVLRILL
jgi:hypothetical protein